VPDLKKTLISRLANAKRIALLAIGSDLRGDDTAGILVALELEKSLKKSKLRVPLRIFKGETAPENLTGEIKKFRPTDILIVDSIEMKKRAGTIALIDPARLGGGVTFSTHTMPAKILADYFLKSFECRITMIGIQPKSIEFGRLPSKSVISSARKIAKSILQATEGLTN